MELRVEAGMAGMGPSCRLRGLVLDMISCPEMNYMSVILPGDAHAACRGAGHADRRPAQDAEETGPGSEDMLAGPAAGTDRARRCPGPGQYPDRRGPGHRRGYGAQVAGPVRRAGPARAGGPAPVRAAAADQRGGPGGGGRPGLPAASRDRGAAVPLDRAGAGRRAEDAGPGQRAHVGDITTADPGGEPGQAVAVPVLDLSPRPGLRRESERDPGPLPGHVPGRAARPQGQDLVLRRQAVHPGPRPSRPATSPAWSSYHEPCSPSPAATTRPRSRSTGNSPPPTSQTCSTASANTSRPPPHARPTLHQQHDPRRTYGVTH